MDDEAVSPVIAVILMVAITVVLGATAYIVVGQFPPERGTQDIRFTGTADEARDEWGLIRGPADGVQRSDIQWRGDAGVRYAVDVPATAASPLVPTQWTALGGDEPWQGGSSIRFCADGLVPATEWSFTFRAAESGSLLGKQGFGTIAPCP